MVGGIYMPFHMFLHSIQKLCDKTKCFRIILENEICYGDSFYQCVYVKCKIVEELIELNEKSNLVLNRKPNDYMPHLSLVYGDINENVKLDIIKYINGNKWINFKDNIAFNVDKIEIWKTDPAYGKSIEWDAVQFVSFGNNTMDNNNDAKLDDSDVDSIDSIEFESMIHCIYEKY